MSCCFLVCSCAGPDFVVVDRPFSAFSPSRWSISEKDEENNNNIRPDKQEEKKVTMKKETGHSERQKLGRYSISSPSWLRIVVIIVSLLLCLVPCQSVASSRWQLDLNLNHCWSSRRPSATLAATNFLKGIAKIISINSSSSQLERSLPGKSWAGLR